MIESTTSALVIITTIVFGGVTSVIQNALLSNAGGDQVDNDDLKEKLNKDENGNELNRHGFGSINNKDDEISISLAGNPNLTKKFQIPSHAVDVDDETTDEKQRMED